MTFRKTAAQVEATKLLSSPAKNLLLYGGSRSGKTLLLVRAIIIRALKEPGSRHAIFRYRFNHAKTSIYQGTLPRVFELCFPELPVNGWNHTDLTCELHNKSIIYVCGLDDKERTEKVLGNEFSTIFLNEASQIPYTSFQIALTRLAQKTSLINRVYVDCNPPTTGHWLYKYFILKRDPISGLPHAHPENYVSMRMNPEDNRENIADDYIEEVLGALSERQKKRFLHGEWGDDNPYALFKHEDIDKYRIPTHKGLKFNRIVVGVDPAVTSTLTSDLTGIVVVAKGENEHYYVLADYSLSASPLTWASAVCKAYYEYKADRVIGEVNQGGDLIETTLRSIDQTIPFKAVHATRGKAVRAEPIAALYEQGVVHHIGLLSELETEMCEWVPNDRTQGSPDRCDALVWAITELMSHGKISYSILGGERR